MVICFVCVLQERELPLFLGVSVPVSHTQLQTFPRLFRARGVVEDQDPWAPMGAVRLASAAPQHAQDRVVLAVECHLHAKGGSAGEQEGHR